VIIESRLRIYREREVFRLPWIAVLESHMVPAEPELGDFPLLAKRAMPRWGHTGTESES